MIRVGISGASGRMGIAILDELKASFADTAVVGGLYSNRHNINLSDLFSASDVILDFSSPENVRILLEEAQNHNVPLLIGTTGLTQDDFSIMRDVASNLPLLYAPNTSFGIYVTKQLTKLLATLLPEDYDIEILDKHHIHKQDAPSGTAIALRQTLQSVTNKDDDAYPIASMRLGGIAGEHDVIAASPHESITISHSLLGGRKALSYGAIKAGLWLHKQKPGKLYSIEDMM